MRPLRPPMNSESPIGGLLQFTTRQDPHTRNAAPTRATHSVGSNEPIWADSQRSMPFGEFSMFTRPKLSKRISRIGLCGFRGYRRQCRCVLIPQREPTVLDIIGCTTCRLHISPSRPRRRSAVGRTDVDLRHRADSSSGRTWLSWSVIESRSASFTTNRNRTVLPATGMRPLTFRTQHS